MSAVDLPSLATNTDNEQPPSKLQTPMQNINAALKECGFGWFQIRVLCAGYFGVSTGICITNLTPYIMPNAECDLDMTLLRKGVLTAIPYIGMLFSSIVAGFLVDTFGRKIFLVGGYASLILFNFITSMSQTYYIMITAKLFEGIAFAIAFNPTMTYTSEFCHPGIRDKVMLTQSAFLPVSQVLLAVLSWVILVNDWRYVFFGGYFVLNTWNFYLLFMTSYAISACLLYSFLPESPKYLITQHRYEEAREILCSIYRLNTGKPVDSFTYVNVWKDKRAAIAEEPEHPKTTLSQQLTAGMHGMKPLVKKPHNKNLLLLCFVMFSIMCMYNVVRLWYPQLSTVVEHYSTAENQELCTMLDAYTRDLALKQKNSTVEEVCVPVKSGAETYINSIILSSVCIPPFLLTGLIVNKVGKKFLIIILGCLSVAATLGLRWSNSKELVVALFSIDLSLGQTMMSLVQAATMEFFPTEVRTMAISIVMTIGRIGTLVGNVLFPVLLNMGCVVPFFSMGGLMLLVTVTGVILPNKKK